MKKEERDKYDKTYGIFKFKKPLPKESENAMGLAGESTLFKKLISADYERFYDPIKTPEDGDWLMTHKEFGQTYNEFILKDCFPVQPGRNVIYIVPLSFNSNCDYIDQQFYECIISLLEAFFSGMKINIIEVSNNFKNIDTKQQNEKLQINANQLLERLVDESPDDAYCLFGLIDTDLYTETFLPNGKSLIKATYSIRNLQARISLFSFARFDPFFNYKSTKISKEKKLKIYLLLLKRVCSAITREICYMFGMKNCIFFCCCMNGTSTSEFDSKQIELCPICLRKLITTINAKGQDLKSFRMKNPIVVYERFVKLRDVLDENFFGLYENELSWFNARIDFLNTLI